MKARCLPLVALGAFVATTALDGQVGAGPEGFVAEAARIEPAGDVALDEVVARARSAVEPIWVAYRIEALPRRGGFCCWRSSCCRIEEDRELSIAHHDRNGSDELLILLRFAGGRIDRIRALAADCPLAFGDRVVLWAGERPSDDSLALVRRMLDEADPDETSDALLALSLHRGAESTLVELARRDESPRMRKDALFWLGQSRPDRFETVYRAALEDRDPDVAEHAVFVLSQMDEPGSLEHLARLLAQERRSDLRRQALFWIGQSSSPEALDIVARILND